MCHGQAGEAVLPDWVGQEAQAPGQLDFLPEGECSNGPLKGDWDWSVTQMEFTEWYLAGLRKRLGIRICDAMGRWYQPLPMCPQIPSAMPSTHLLEGLPELATRGHAQLLSDVSRHLQQQHLHESRHEPILQEEEPCQLHCTE